MSLADFEEKPDRKAQRYMQMRSMTDIGMGLVYVGIGVVVLFAKQFRFENENLMGTPAKIFAVLAIVYGSWRIYRGIRKDYFKKR